MPPINDNFANATLLDATLGLSQTMQDDNTGATSDGVNDPLVNFAYGEPTIWYKIDPYGTDRILIVGTSAPISGAPIYDSVIGVYKGTTLAGLTLISYDDDSGPGAYSQLSALIPTGETIYIELTGYSDIDYGAFTFNWRVSNLVVGDFFNDAVNLTL